MRIAQVSAAISEISYSAVARPLLTSSLRTPSDNFVAGTLTVLTHSSNSCRLLESVSVTIVLPELLELEFQVGVEITDQRSFWLGEPASLLSQYVDDIAISQFPDER